MLTVACTAVSTAVAGGTFCLRDGTPMKLRLMQTVSSATAQVNDNVNFESLEAIIIDGVTVIPKGATAIGTVTAAQPKRRLGRAGKLDITIDYVRLPDGEKAALRAVKNTKGKGHTGAMTAGMVATGLIVWPAAPFFLFMHGKDVTVPEGTEITAFVNGDMDLDPHKFGLADEAEGPQATAAREAQRALSSVMVNSTPSGADITVDKGFVGSTPSRLELAGGSHLIVIQEAGYTNWQRTVTTTSGEQITINAVLSKTPAANVQ
jgi:hypothetical protein